MVIIDGAGRALQWGGEVLISAGNRLCGKKVSKSSDLQYALKVLCLTIVAAAALALALFAGTVLIYEIGTAIWPYLPTLESHFARALVSAVVTATAGTLAYIAAQEMFNR